MISKEVEFIRSRYKPSLYDPRYRKYRTDPEFFTKEKKFYWTWRNMLQRIQNPNHKDYKYYGGQSMTHDFLVYRDFADYLFTAYLEAYKDGDTTVERIDGNKGYVYGNLKIATREEQMSNTRKTVYYEAVSPQGKVFVGRNLNKFARTYSIKIHKIRECIKNPAQNHNGWAVKLISKEEYMARTDEIILPVSGDGLSSYEQYGFPELMNFLDP